DWTDLGWVEATAVTSGQGNGIYLAKPGVTVNAGDSIYLIPNVKSTGNASVAATIAGGINFTPTALPTVVQAASADAMPAAAISAGLHVLGGYSPESSLSYTWSVLTKPAGAANPIFSVNGTNAAKDTAATFSQ